MKTTSKIIIGMCVISMFFVRLNADPSIITDAKPAFIAFMRDSSE